MAIKLKTPGEYRRAIEQLRRYADGFTAADGYDLRKLQGMYDNPLSESRKKRVREYFDVLQRHAGYKGFSYQHFRDTKKLKSAQRAMGMPDKGTWRGVFVPEPSENTPAKLVQHGRGVDSVWTIEYQMQGVDTVFVPFDRLLFAEHDISYVRGLLHGLPADYRYNLDMGYGRNRWKAGGNLEQMLRDLTHIVGQYGHFSEFVAGVHVYRGGLAAFNELKWEQVKTKERKIKTQEEIRKIIRKERRELHDYQEWQRLKRKFGQ